ncbi:hypothetical protein F3I62_03560 [Pseudomonas sp. R-28-1W-6]|uniref:hypothetical protein n=1 Tax=Pseudomonas sp. R-28-1W-6 TaxID=2650101 RepID=UPI0013654748|nr:hypothetical protein [Pseudomonas sp. R-28-1W-6]MWV11165.1 hypothetical protein [Pseudomonas sp. R-28-1W-6]
MNIAAHVQAVAIQFISYRGDITALAKFVAASMVTGAPSIADLVHYLRKESTAKELQEYEVGLWRNTAGDWSLVSLATPPTIEAMKYRLDNFPVSNTQCRWCLQDAKRLADLELISEIDLHGLPVHRSRLHPQCMRPWLSMRTQVARAGVVHEQ